MLENLYFSEVFRGCRNKTMTLKGLPIGIPVKLLKSCPNSFKPSLKCNDILYVVRLSIPNNVFSTRLL